MAFACECTISDATNRSLHQMHFLSNLGVNSKKKSHRNFPTLVQLAQFRYLNDIFEELHNFKEKAYTK